MKDILARNISRYRKEKGMTQEELARKLGLTFQAVSKWENAQTMPDITLLPELAQMLEVIIDKLLGYRAQEKPVTIYEEEYKTPGYYWGTEPNSQRHLAGVWRKGQQPKHFLYLAFLHAK